MRRHIRVALASVLSLVLVGGSLMTGRQVLAQRLGVVQVASEQLCDALSALRQGQFDRGSELLKQAATASRDPKLELMASWVSAFTTQYEQTMAGRKAEHDKAVAQAKLLLSKGYPDYALDYTARAYSLARTVCVPSRDVGG